MRGAARSAPVERVDLHVCEDPAALSVEAARRVWAEAGAAVAARGRFTVALAGGSTPRALYALLAASPAVIAWDRVEVFFGDERCVGPDEPQSNYRMARDALLAHVPVRPECVHRLRGEAPDPAEAAGAYDALLRGRLGEPPVLDLALLGIGADGHTASLFPGSAVLREERAYCRAVYVPQCGAWRLTLTMPALVAARRLLFIVAGVDKAPVLGAVLAGPIDPDRLPAQRLLRQHPRPAAVTLLIDRAAAAEVGVERGRGS